MLNTYKVIAVAVHLPNAPAQEGVEAAKKAPKDSKTPHVVAEVLEKMVKPGHNCYLYVKLVDGKAQHVFLGKSLLDYTRAESLYGQIQKLSDKATIRDPQSSYFQTFELEVIFTVNSSEVSVV